MGKLTVWLLDALLGLESQPRYEALIDPWLKKIRNWEWLALGMWDCTEHGGKPARKYFILARNWTIWNYVSWSHNSTLNLTHFIQPSIAFHIESSHLFCCAKQVTGFYMKRNTGMKWVNSRIGLNGHISSRNWGVFYFWQNKVYIDMFYNDRRQLVAGQSSNIVKFASFRGFNVI